MKHVLLVAAGFLALGGCPMDTSNGGGGVTPGQDNPVYVYAEECWGEWIRMDEAETWYISGGSIKINNAVTTKSLSLSKQSDRVIEVTEGGRKYYLYASRIANTSFTGKVAGFEGVSLSMRSAAGGIPSIQRAVAGGKGWIKVVAENLENGSTQTAETDENGEFTVEGAIPGDEYEVTPEGGTPVTVTPAGDGDDVGTITVTEGVNFKTRIRKAEADDPDILYANDGVSHDFILEVTNTGTDDCLAANYQLNFDEGLVTTASTATTRWGTVEPGAKITVELSLQCEAIEEEYEYKKIAVTITDTINQRVWEDSVSVKFYKVPIYLYLKTDPAAA